MEKSKRSGLLKVLPPALVGVLLIVLLGLYGDDLLKDFVDKPAPAAPQSVTVHFIDVAQGSATLIQDGKNGILIDAGEREYADTVIAYLKNCGVTKLKYVIATHPHSDHIGALADVIDAFGAEMILLPKLPKALVPTTSSYRNLLKTVKDKGVNSVYASCGAQYTFGRHVKFTLLGPVTQNEDLNNMSIVCTMKIFGTRFLFSADAETAELKTIMDSGADVCCDVMLTAHHGSSNALYLPYLDAAAPKVAVISCGKNNDYGHPHKDVLDYLKKKKVEVHRTDKEGSVVIRVQADGYAFAA